MFGPIGAGATANNQLRPGVDTTNNSIFNQDLLMV